MEFPSLSVVLLAGGKGTRLFPLTLQRPKPILPLRGRPMVESVLENLDRSYVRSVFLTVSYGAHFFEAVAGQVVLEEECLGTGGAVAALRDKLPGHILVLNADTLLKLELDSFYRFHLEREAEVSIAVVEVPDSSRYGAVRFDHHQQIAGFSEKSGSGSAGWINAGAYLIAPGVRLPEEMKFSLEKDFFPTLAPEMFLAWPCPGPFRDLGTPVDYLAAHLEEHSIDPSVVLGRGCQILEPSYLGPGCEIEADSTVESSFLERDVLVESGCHVSESILAEGVVLPAGSRVHRKIVVQGEPWVDF